MSLDYINSKKIRKSFGKIPLVTSLPNLIEVQKRSFDNFLQLKSELLKSFKIVDFMLSLNLFFQLMITLKEQLLTMLVMK